MRIEISDGAQQDLIDGAASYDRRERGVGTYFLDCLFSDIDSLILYAGIHPVIHHYYRLLSKRFPFAVFYRVDGLLVRIHAVLDCRRDPAWIRRRLQ
jgi:plasmid stabilization system protein ParE